MAKLINRFDPIEYNYSGGWDYSLNAKEREDGEFVKCEDVKALLDKFFELSNKGESFNATCLLAKLSIELSG